MGSHNVVLGTNVTVGNNATSSLNIGGVLFGSGLYSTVNDSPYSGSANGKIGINQPNPEYNLDISGSTRITQNLIVTGSLTASLQSGYVWVGNSSNISTLVATSSFAGSPASITTAGTTLYSTNPGTGGFSTVNSIYFGSGSGYSATFSSYSNFIGRSAGYAALDASYSNFLGYRAGYAASNAYDSNFIGENAGSGSTNGNDSNFLGYIAGAGAVNAQGSNFFGNSAGYNAVNASYSNLFGYKVANNSNIGSNNIIIGTNITLPDSTVDSINIGGLIFGTGSYSNTAGSPYSGQTNGKIGINQPLPTSTFEVSGSRAGRFVRYTTANNTFNNEEFIDYSYVQFPGNPLGTGTLPAASSCPGRAYHIRNSGVGDLNLNPGYITPAGATVTTLPVGESIMIVSDGTDWLYFAS